MTPRCILKKRVACLCDEGGCHVAYAMQKDQRPVIKVERKTS